MSVSRTYRSIMTALILTVSFVLHAQTEGVVMHFASLTTDPVELGIGGIGLHGGNTEPESSVTAGYMLFSPDGSPVSYMNLEGTYSLNARVSLSLEGRYGFCEEYEMFNQNGRSDGFYRPGQMMVAAGAEYRHADFLKAGLKLKYLNESLAPDAEHGAFASDIHITGNIAFSSRSSVIVDLGIDNLGSKVRSAAGQSFPLPTSLPFCAGYYGVFGKGSALEVLAEVNWFLCGSLAAAAGASYIYNDLISVRCGYHYGGQSVVPSFASAGAGLNIHGIRLDLAYIFGSGTMSNSLAVSLGYTF